MRPIEMRAKSIREHIMANHTNPPRDQQHDLEDLREPMSSLDMVHVVVSTREEELLWALRRIRAKRAKARGSL